MNETFHFLFFFQFIQMNGMTDWHSWAFVQTSSGHWLETSRANASQQIRKSTTFGLVVTLQQRKAVYRTPYAQQLLGFTCLTHCHCFGDAVHAAPKTTTNALKFSAQSVKCRYV